MVTTAYPDVVRVEGVSKTFRIHRDTSIKERVLHSSRSRVEQFQALDDVSIAIPMSQTVGLMGHNGSGKSTLLKIMGSIIRPTTGRVTTRGRMAALLELGAGFHQDLTGRENVFLNASILGMSRAETERQLDAIVDFSGIEQFIDTQVKFYSSGMYVRLAFAVAVHSDPDVLLVDEVLAVGDEPFQRKCMDKIGQFQREGRSIVLVSHSADQVNAVCTRGIVLDHGRMVFDGDTQEAVHVLREGFERAGRMGKNLTPPLQGKVRITSIEVIDAQGNRTHSVATGDDVRIRMRFTCDERMDQWLAGMTFETNLGQHLFTFDTRAANSVMPPVEGESVVVFSIPDLPLGDGTYRLNAGIADGEGRTLDHRDDAWDIVVAGPYAGTGPIAMSPTITFSE
ncbi:ABC transporter ATP-binding protein [Actinomyces sp. B33]|uniref:ABC transporter ATP-binding protein n=1 Tax=Actinomyces sp. B33 TaxID=2942131 RepID=UPI0023413D6A|nr:ABC transporter ATP-binding protein [Actinomyces sp. B33]MDC4232655.1 ABC transporter ATP-binding protein [Actinomyces sp. B33]